MKRVLWLGVCLSFVFFLCYSLGLAYTSPGAPSGRVSDFASVLSTEQEQELESVINNFEQATGHQLAVVTVQNLAGDTIENYANELFREWGIGDQTKNNGLLFLIALEDRKMRIEVGYGLEGEVTDIATKHIQDDIVRPAFQAGNYWLGIAGGTNELIKLAGGEAEAIGGINERLAGSSESSLGSFVSENYAIFGLFAIYAVLSILMKVKKWGKEKQKPIFGITGIVFSLGLWLLGLIGFGTLFYLAFLTLVFTFGNKRGRGFGGGFGAGGFSGGGGGGGFGGGSSGGGGSSSSW